MRPAEEEIARLNARIRKLKRIIRETSCPNFGPQRYVGQGGHTKPMPCGMCAVCELKRKTKGV